MGEATSEPVRLPPGPRLPKIVTGVAFLAARHRAVATLGRRHGDLGPWSPWGRVQRHRRRYDDIIKALIFEARTDPAFEELNDVLALLLQARYDDDSPISDGHVADELLTLLAAGHETTATTLAWAIERLRRHPRLLSRLTEEVDAGGAELRQATIWEVQRTRPVVEATTRVTRTRIRLGERVIPKDHAVIASITLAHGSEANFPDAKSFNPDRFIGNPPDNHSWIPYGGGIRRCIGASFANMEMNVTLRTLLREFEFGTTYARGERRHSRGVATAPGRGGRAVVYRRTPRAKQSMPSGAEVSAFGGATIRS
jgi:cytochrome P450